MKQKTNFKETEAGRIPEDWEVKKVDEIKSKEKKAVISGPFGSNIGQKYFVDSGIPVIRGNNLTTDMKRFIDRGFVFVTEEKAEELGTWAFREDLVFTAAGTIGQVGIIEESSKYGRYIISNKQLRLRVDKNKVRPLFAYYWFSNKKMTKRIQNYNTGSTIPLINTSILKDLPVVLPSLDEQEGIIHLLDSLDSKIELNNRMNKTLEAIGQAIFKHWFVDFEFPNKEGKPYKSSGGEMVDSELGEIPKEWEITNLIAWSTLMMGLSPKGDSYNDTRDGSPLLNGAADFSEETIKPRKFTSRPTRICKKDDLIFCIRATIGNLTIADKEYCLGRGVAAITPNNEAYTEFMYFSLKHSFDSLISIASGSVILGLSKSDIGGLKLVTNKNIIELYHNMMEKLFVKKIALTHENKNLSYMRDILLPKLMSGQIRVPVEAST
ncbi:restriction endonuclease subunit S [Patescibacteria group bacterium]|nr:restriction endonuclease subunit S [Patescibacteria group bacterium]